MASISSNEIEFLRRELVETPRKRTRYCAHSDEDQRLQEMFVVLTAGTYIRPHLHVAKSESLHVIDGYADAVFFDETGDIREVLQLGPYGSGLRFYYRVDEPLYHTLALRSKEFVFHESTEGPFLRARSGFAPWAPEEGSGEEARFQDELEGKIKMWKASNQLACQQACSSNREDR